MLPALALFLLATSGLDIGKWSGLKLFRHQYRHLTPTDEQTEVVKRERGGTAVLSLFAPTIARGALLNSN